MKTKPLLQKINSKTFLQDYLQAKGITNVQNYLYPDRENNFESFKYYPNMEQAVNSFLTALETNSYIGVLVDSDNDGLCSAALIVNFINEIKPNAKIKPFFHKGKEHGLRKSADEDIVSQVIEEKINYLIIPDAGSNDVEECKLLLTSNINVLILDHHEIMQLNPYAIVVNHHLCSGLNTALSGTGVTYKFVEAVCNHMEKKTPYYEDLVAISLISDVCDLSSIENRTYLDIGLTKINNPMIELLYTKLCRNNQTNPHTVSWGCVPPINALCRGDNQDDKVTFFNALTGQEEPSEGLKVARRAHRIQTAEVKKIMEEIEPTLDTSHKVIVGFTKNENKNYTGLVANKIMSIYGKPVILLREVNPLQYSGSIRSIIPLATRINKSKLAKCQGHEEACGILVDKSNYKKLLQWFDTLNLSESPDIPVTACLALSDIDFNLCRVCTENKILWGHGIEEPLFYVKTEIYPHSIQLFKKSTTTIKFTKGGIDFLKFSATQNDIDTFESIVKENKIVSIEAIVTLGINDWNDNYTSQCLIEKYEIVDEECEEEDGF